MSHPPLGVASAGPAPFWGVQRPRTAPPAPRPLPGAHLERPQRPESSSLQLGHGAPPAPESSESSSSSPAAAWTATRICTGPLPAGSSGPAGAAPGSAGCGWAMALPGRARPAATAAMPGLRQPPGRLPCCPPRPLPLGRRSQLHSPGAAARQREGPTLLQPCRPRARAAAQSLSLAAERGPLWFHQKTAGSSPQSSVSAPLLLVQPWGSAAAP